MDSKEEIPIFPENPSKEECEGKEESAASSGSDGQCKIFLTVNMQPVASSSASDQAVRKGGNKECKGAPKDRFSVSSTGGDDFSMAAMASTSGEKASARQSDSVPSSTSTEAFDLLSSLIEMMNSFEILLARQLQTISQQCEMIIDIWRKLQQLNQRERNFLSSFSPGKNKQTSKKNTEIVTQADHISSAAAACAQNEEAKDDGNDGDDGESIEEGDADDEDDEDDDVNGNKGASHFESKKSE